MADNYLNQTGLQYYHNRAKTVFADKGDFDDLYTQVQGIVAEGGEPNVIEVVKVNGTALTPVNKAVDVEVPTNTSDLTNNGDGTDNNSPFATQAYVGANGGKIDVIKVNGTAQTITNKEVDITVPTTVAQLTDHADYALATDIPTKTSDLTNDSDFQDSTEVQALIDAALADITGISFEVVQTLPQTGEPGTIYLVSNSGSGTNIYNEYIYTNNAWEKIGSTDVDLTQYWSKAELTAITTAQIDTIIGA